MLFYFVKFKKKGTILSKKYPKDYAIDGLDQRPIILIIHDENTFFVNNRRQKV